MLKPFLAGIALCLLVSAACAQKSAKPRANSQSQVVGWPLEPTTVMGIALGQPLSASNVLDCPVPHRSHYDQMCVVRQQVSPTITLPARLEGHDVKAWVEVTEQDGVVAKIRLTFAQFRFEEFREMLTTRYGAPTEDTTKSVQNLAGSQFPSRLISWDGRHVSLWLDERHSKIDESAAVFVDNAALVRLLEKQKADAKSAGSKL